VQLDNSKNTATPGLDYEHNEGILIFEAQETIKTINIAILERSDLEKRDESFGIQLFDITPAGAKLTKKAF